MNSHTQEVWYIGINISTQEIENCALIVIDDHTFLKKTLLFIVGRSIIISVMMTLLRGRHGEINVFMQCWF
jgi:hypothetical protein